MLNDLAGAHAAGVHRDDLLVEAVKATLVLRDQLRAKACLPSARDLQIDPPALGRHRLAAITVPAVAVEPIAGVVAEGRPESHPVRFGCRHDRMPWCCASTTNID